MPTVRWLVRILVVALLGSALMLSCQTTSPQYQMNLAGPLIIGAEYVGMDTCEVCHPEQVKRFPTTTHFGTNIKGGELLKGEACESCHGAGSLHVDSGGDPTKIVRYSADRCFVCHVDKRAEFQLQYHHPVPEKWMKCTDCHDPHSEDALPWSSVSYESPGEVCFKCHKNMRGPFVFTHDPVRDGCQICHNPHGSVFDKLLVANQPVLCLRCHWQQTINTASPTIGDVNHGSFASIGRGQECADHHVATHGSNVERDFLN
jgi:predicted CXXCH cytochrome family protein